MGTESIDAQLGAAEERFFGSGYMRVSHSISPLRVDADGADYIAKVIYPGDWSLKQGTEQSPHLTSVDAIALAVTLAEDYLRRVMRLAESWLGRFWIRTCTVAPGAHPTTELERMSARLDAVAPSDVSADWQFRCRLGSFSVDFALGEDHGPADAALHASLESYFGGAFRLWRRELGAVTHNEGVFSARARLSEPSPESSMLTGIESEFVGMPSLLDAVIFCAQVGQVALYSLDGLHRHETDPLWLRRAKFVRATPSTTSFESLICSVRIDRTQFIERNGVRWRTASLVGAFAGIAVTFQLAHSLSSTVPLVSA